MYVWIRALGINCYILNYFFLFGAKALPEIARNLGKAIKTIKKQTKDIQDEIESDSDQ